MLILRNCINIKRVRSAATLIIVNEMSRNVCSSTRCASREGASCSRTYVLLVRKLSVYVAQYSALHLHSGSQSLRLQRKKTAQEKAEKKDRCKKQLAAQEERAALERRKRPCEAVMKSVLHNGDQCSKPCLADDSGHF